MKHNPRLNEKMARLPGFADIHPLQPVSTVQGALEMMEQLGPLADDAHQQPPPWPSRPRPAPMASFCGMMAIKAAQEAAGQGLRTAPRNMVLVPEIGPRHQSGHGRVPRLFRGEAVPARADGRVDVEAMKAATLARGRGHHGDQPQHLRPVRADR